LGVRCMAAGVYDDQGKLVAGLSISAPADRLDEGWLPKLQATAKEISHALGHTASAELTADAAARGTGLG
ncbi:MAG: IclR family transcriptional regulator, partial [Comamonadaceae bacterium]